MGTIKKEFNVGDSVFWAECSTKEVQDVCPICYGKYKVVLILGNGEEIETPCDFCNKGFSEPRGYVTHWEFVSKVSKIILDKKEINESKEGKQVEYRYGCYVLYDTDVFETKGEAEKRCLEKIEVHHKEELEKLAQRKEYSAKSYSWHVGYHQREAKKAQENLEYHSAKAIACKKLAKV